MNSLQELEKNATAAWRRNVSHVVLSPSTSLGGFTLQTPVITHHEMQNGQIWPKEIKVDIPRR